MIGPLLCTGCGAALRIDPAGGAVCEHCGLVYAAPQTLCSKCRRVNREGDDFCSACGTALTALCPICGHANWSGAFHCSACGGDLHMLDHAFHTFQENYLEQRTRWQAGIPELRREEEAVSRGRLQALENADELRLRREAVESGRRMARQKAITVIMSAAVLIFLFVSILLVYLGSR